MPDYDDYTYPLARAFGFLGGIAVAISTMIAWYDYEVVSNARPIALVFQVPVDLWSYDALAAALLVAAGLVAMALLVTPDTVSPRWPSIIAGLIGLGVTAYALYRCFDTPDLGIRPRSAVQARTFVDGGALLAVVGGVIITVGAIAVLVGAHRATTVGRERARPVAAPPPSGAAPA
jgi:L-lactate permease